MMNVIDINCDMGESFGACTLDRDKEAISYISSANIALEAFPDRQYTDEGELVPRKQAGVVLNDPEQIAKRAVAMVVKKGIESISGRWIDMSVDNLCIHGDNPLSTDAAGIMADAFTREGIQIKPLGEIIPR